MLFRLVLQGLRRGKARFACAVAGIAIAAGTLVFMTSLVATNNAQAPAMAKKASAPWAAWKTEGLTLGMGRRGAPPPDAKVREGKPDGERPGRRGGRRGPKADLELKAVVTTVDYRPGGHVLQGPPMMAFIAEAPAENPYANVKLTEGRWVDPAAAEAEVVCVKTSMRRFGRGQAPALGEPLKFVGKNGTMSAKVVGYLEGGKLPAEFPYVFANAAAFAGLANESIGSVSFFRELPPMPPRPPMTEATTSASPRAGQGRPQLLTAESESVINSFKGDEQRRMDYATPLLLIAAFLTAISLLVNSLLLSVESNRSTLATLRIVGLTRFGVVGFVLLESLLSGFTGWLVGVLGAMASLTVYVAADAEAFPAGVAFDPSRIQLTLAVLPVVIFLAVLFALAPALRVRGMDAAARLPRPRRRGMALTFALGFAAFVAVEVWGASLMRGFVPSPEWPDAIVSLLPGGMSSYDVEKLRDIEGVKRISELVPRQLEISEKGKVKGEKVGESPEDGKPARPKFKPNALFLAAEFLPKFDFVEGTWEEASAALQPSTSNLQPGSSDAVVITLMMSNALNLHKGDKLTVKKAGRGRPGQPAPVEELAFPIVGVVDLNWHMVTSRGLVRGLNGSPGMTTGPVFCSLDTMGLIDPRTYMTEPAFSAPMTHLWVEYEPEYVARHGVFAAGRMIEAEIVRRLGNPVGATVRLHARDEIADGTLAHGTDVIGQAARVPFVFLAILAIGFVAMLVAEADARRREFTVLRAVGATRFQLAAALAKSALKTALVGIVAGLPLGAVAGWYVAIGTAKMWAGMPHYFVIPWPVVLEGALGAVVFALIFAVPTALLLVRRRRRSPRN